MERVVQQGITAATGVLHRYEAMLRRRADTQRRLAHQREAAPATRSAAEQILADRHRETLRKRDVARGQHGHTAEVIDGRVVRRQDAPPTGRQDAARIRAASYPSETVARRPTARPTAASAPPPPGRAAARGPVSPSL
jgi:hypothetical protein